MRIERYRPSRIRGRGVGVGYAERDGSAVLRGQARWWKVNAVWVNTSRHMTWYIFRRVSR